MEQTIIEVLKIQRNEAMDTIAVLNGHLAQLRREKEELQAKLDAGAEGPTVEQLVADSY